ncbi:MAG: SDR family oxidoreductase [Candidatus Nanopelagicales bacterium]|nr:SDR family oxidoreductase [Candidatus Nanopelagicales bacterium]
MAWRNDEGLVGRVVVVTGAAGGIGRSVCTALDEAGARLFVVDVTQTAVDDVLAGLTGSGHGGGAFDLGDLSTHDVIFSQARELGELAALTHMAAVLVRRATVDDVTEEDWDLQHDVNLKATFFLNRAAQHAFIAQGTGGSIVNFTSQGWWTGGFGGSVVYAASKGGIVSLTRGLARSFAPTGVRVNAVSPGGVDTPMMRSGMTDEAMAGFVAMIPLGRLADPDELAGSVLFLASDASRYLTGTVINVSGGQLMY